MLKLGFTVCNYSYDIQTIRGCKITKALAGYIVYRSQFVDLGLPAVCPQQLPNSNLKLTARKR